MNDIWDYIAPEFSKTENWGEPAKVSGLLLLTLSVIRRESGWPVEIHNAVEYEGHNPEGQHPLGGAADWHFVTDAPFYRQILKVEEILDRYQLSNFVGLGIYPFWNNQGFHLDARGSKARWGFDRSKMVSYDAAKLIAKGMMTDGLPQHSALEL